MRVVRRLITRDPGERRNASHRPESVRDVQLNSKGDAETCVSLDWRPRRQDEAAFGKFLNDADI